MMEGDLFLYVRSRLVRGGCGELFGAARDLDLAVTVADTMVAIRSRVELWWDTKRVIACG